MVHELLHVGDSIMVEANKDKFSACGILINHFEWLMWEQMKLISMLLMTLNIKGNYDSLE